LENSVTEFTDSARPLPRDAPFPEFSMVKPGEFVADGVETAHGMPLLNFEPVQFRLCSRQTFRGNSR
jgi:hypothetical protein